MGLISFIYCPLISTSKCTQILKSRIHQFQWFSNNIFQTLPKISLLFFHEPYVLKHFDSLNTLTVAQTVKHLPTVQKTWVQSLGWEHLLEKEMVTQSSILAWKIPWTEKPGKLQSMGSQRVEHDWATSLSLTFWSLPAILSMYLEETMI